MNKTLWDFSGTGSLKNSLRYNKMANPARLERATYCLEGLFKANPKQNKRLLPRAVIPFRARSFSGNQKRLGLFWDSPPWPVPFGPAH